MGAAFNAGASTSAPETAYGKAGVRSVPEATARPSDPRASITAQRGSARVRTCRSVGSSASRLASPRKNVKTPSRLSLKESSSVAGVSTALWGSVIYADDWGMNDAAYGLYAVPTSDSEEFELLHEGVYASRGGVLVDDVYYWNEIEYAPDFTVAGVDYYGIDVNTGEKVFSAAGSRYTWSMTLDPVTENVYAVVDIDETPVLAILSFDNGFEFREVARFSGDFDEMRNGWNSIACGPDGQLYGITYDYDESYRVLSSSLCKIDKTDGTVTKVGVTGQLPVYVSDCTVDRQTGRMYWTVSDDFSGYLCEVDLDTGTATKVYDFPMGEQVVGLVIPAPKVPGGSPAAGELTVTPGQNGALTASVRFKVPSRTMDGNRLTSLTSVELSRDGEVIKTWDAPAPGTELTFDDAPAESGSYRYSVVCSNEEGSGARAAVTVFVGVNLPAAVSGVTWTETDNPGEVTISWDAVTSDISGNHLDASQVTYQVYALGGMDELIPVSGSISDTSYTYQAVMPGKQAFLQYAVCAGTATGEGEGAVSNFDPAGTPYNEMTFSSQADFNRYALSTSSQGGASWGVYTDSMFDGITSFDGDDMFFGMYSQYLRRYADILTGYFTLTDLANPAVSFHIYNAELLGGAPNINEVAVWVREKSSTEWTELKKAVACETAELEAWGKVIASLSDYAGKTIQIKFTGTAYAASYTYIDCLKVGSVLDNDLSVTSLVAPDKVGLGQAYTVVATVMNQGSNAAGAYSVGLYEDGSLVETKELNGLGAGETVKVGFDRVMSGLATEPVVCHAEVVYAPDQAMENNRSVDVEIAPVLPSYPVATDLAGESKGSAVELRWNTPDLGKAAGESVTQDFEDGVAFSDSYGDWTFVDLDGRPVGGFNELEIPNITSGVTTGSFWIWDASQVGNATFAAHSGSKYLFSMYNGMQVDDWAISPELDGSAQTVSFYAKSYTASYPEEIEVYCSEGSVQPEDFVQVQGVGGVVPNEWTLYTVDVPEGTRHFAIRSCSNDRLMLMIDDVSFIPAGAAHNLEIKGYNVYRDGVKVSGAPVETTSYTDMDVEDGKTYTYKVTVEYNKGESAASNAAQVRFDSSGIGSVEAGTVMVAVAESSIVVTGAEGLDIDVYTADGKLVGVVSGGTRTVIPVSQGVYVVRTGSTATKVIVK